MPLQALKQGNIIPDKIKLESGTIAFISREYIRTQLPKDFIRFKSYAIRQICRYADDQRHLILVSWFKHPSRLGGLVPGRLPRRNTVVLYDEPTILATL